MTRLSCGPAAGPATQSPVEEIVLNSNPVETPAPEENYAEDDEFAGRVAAPRVDAVDATGAGDAFSAGMDLKEYFREVDSQPNHVLRRVRRDANYWQWRLLRTYPNRRRGYPFAPDGERSIARSYIKVLRRARALIYLEDQYLWSRRAAGLLVAALRRAPDLRVIAADRPFLRALPNVARQLIFLPVVATVSAIATPAAPSSARARRSAFTGSRWPGRSASKAPSRRSRRRLSRCQGLPGQVQQGRRSVHALS